MVDAITPRCPRFPVWRQLGRSCEILVALLTEVANESAGADTRIGEAVPTLRDHRH